MKKNLLSLLVLFAILLGMVSSVSATPGVVTSPVPQTDQYFTDYIVARVYFTSQEDLNNLAARLDIWEVNHDQGYFIAMLSPEEYATLQQAGYRLEIDEKKTQMLNQPMVALPGQGPDTIPGYPCYRTVEETYAAMQSIVTSHPDLAQIFDIGDSWTRIHSGFPYGYDILALRLTNENFGVIAEKPAFFLMAEIHAREYTTAETAMRYAEYLIDNYGTDPDITWMLDYFRVYIVTMTNPDGRKIAETGDMWRKNVDSDDGCTDPSSWGTDLNRNHSFKWNMGGSSGYPCDETYHGPSAGSEPEVISIEQYIQTLFPDQRGPNDGDPAPDNATGVFISLHSFARVVLYPWGWSTAPSPNAADLRTLGRKFGFFNNYQVCQVSDPYCMYLASGTSDDYAYGTLGVAAYTFEIGTSFFESCASFESSTYPENLPALVYALKAARRPYQNAAGPDSLDLSATPAAAAPGEPVLLTATANDTRYNGGEPTQNITAAQYSIDSPSWITDTVTYSMTASDGNFNNNIEDIQATIDTTGLTAGRHTIFIESKDAGNNWGVASATFLYIIEPGVSPVVEGYVREAGTNNPLDATITAGLFNTTTDPATGYYSMTVISGTYDMVATAPDHAPDYADGVVAQDYQTIQQNFSLYPVCTVFSDDVESGNQGWIPQTPWAITEELSHSPTHSWTDSPGGNYSNNRNISLTSQTFDLSAATGITLSFWHQYQTEAGYDFGYVEYNTGAGWNTVATYDGSQTNWLQEQIPIPALDGQSNARIRFRFYSDYGITDDGWHIDDIVLIAGGPGCLPPMAPTAEFSTNSPRPQGQPMIFTNQTTGSEPMTYAWDFGDGVGTSSERDPTYTYADLGTYTVTLVATNTLGTDSVSHPVTVEPVAITGVDLSQVNPGRIYIGDMVDFSADLLPDNATKPYTYTVNYGDGTVITTTSSLDPLPLSHVFSSEGNYTIQIWVLNAGMTLPVTDNLDLTVWILYKVFLPMAAK